LHPYKSFREIRNVLKLLLTNAYNIYIIANKFRKIKSLIKSGGGTRPCEARQPKNEVILVFKGAKSYRSIDAI